MKKMATGLCTCNALLTETLKECIKTQRKIVSHSNSTRAMPSGLSLFELHGIKMYPAIFFLMVD